MSDMDKSCFTCSKFPNCIYLVDMYNEEENDDDRRQLYTIRPQYGITVYVDVS